MRIIKTLLLASFLLPMFASSAFAADALDESSEEVLPNMDAPFATDSVYSGHVFSFTTQVIASVGCEGWRV